MFVEVPDTFSLQYFNEQNYSKIKIIDTDQITSLFHISGNQKKIQILQWMKLIINHFYLIAVSFGYLIPVIKIHIYIHITRQHEMVKELKGQISFLLIFYHYHTGHFTFLYTSQSLKSEVLILPLYFLEASYWSNEIISVKLYKFKIIPSNSCFLNQSILPFMCIV